MSNRTCEAYAKRRFFHYRPWMGLGIWALGIPLCIAIKHWSRDAVAGVAAVAFFAGFAMSQSAPWGPGVWKCWSGCGHSAAQPTDGPTKPETGGAR